MKIYTVTTNDTDYKILPTNELQEIAQNIRMILTTPKFSVPLFREFGLSYSLLDSPMNAAQSKLTAEIAEQVKNFEPRAVITQLNSCAYIDGNLSISVNFKLKSEV